MISLPDELFEEAEAAARAFGMSHGQLFVRALDSFLHRKRSEEITAKLSEIYADPSSGCDPFGGPGDDYATSASGRRGFAPPDLAVPI
jgi:hypothetical protein